MRYQKHVRKFHVKSRKGEEAEFILHRPYSIRSTISGKTLRFKKELKKSTSLQKWEQAE